VIYPGIVVKDDYLEGEIEKLKQKYHITEKYVLFIGTIEPRKNMKNLIKAFSNYLFECEQSNLTLVLAGAKGWKFQSIFQELENMNKRHTNSQIKYIGKISNRERNIFLQNAQAFIFPSQYEGFGFPVLESMALGAPVVCGDNSSLREIAKDAARLVDVNDVNDIKNGIKEVIEDNYLRAQLIKRGRQRALQFSWDRAVAEVSNKYQ